MNGINEQYENIVTKTLEFIGLHLGEPLPVGKLAKNAGYSESRFRAIIKKATGKNILSHIFSMRLEKARRFLQNTEKGVLEIALEAGFASHEQFCHLFKKKTGLSPSAFRKGNREVKTAPNSDAAKSPIKEANVWFMQKFNGEELDENWTPRLGRFQNNRDAATGGADGEFSLVCNRPLPENFEVRIEVEFQNHGGRPPTEFFLSIQNDTRTENCHHVVFGAHNQQACLLRHQKVEQRIFENPPIKPGTWQAAKLRLFDDTFTVYLDDQLIFEFRNDFPHPYSHRSRLALGAWRSQVRFRNFSIHDLGFPPLVRPTRQGDALFNAGLFDTAREFYARILDSRTSFADTMELYYKIGRCHIAAQSFGQAQAWLEKVISLPENDFWARQARLQKLQMDLIEQNPNVYHDARLLFANEFLRDDIRLILLQTIKKYEQVEGRFLNCVQLGALLMELEKKDSLSELFTMRVCVEPLYWLNRYDEVENILVRILASPKVSKEFQRETLDNLGYVHTMKGRFKESDDSYCRAMELSQDSITRANSTIHMSRNLRGLGLPDQAMNLLEQVHKMGEGLSHSRAYACLEQSQILCGCNRPTEAQKAIRRAEEIDRTISMLSAGFGSTYRYVPLLLLGQFGEAAQILETDSRTKGANAFQEAEQLVKASFLWNLNGNIEKSGKSLKEITRRFPERVCHYFAMLSDDLLKGEWNSLKNLPTAAYHRSELFYLAALTHGKQGQAELEKEFLQMAVKEDPSLRWPAYLAREKLDKK